MFFIGLFLCKEGLFKRARIVRFGPLSRNTIRFLARAIFGVSIFRGILGDYNTSYRYRTSNFILFFWRFFSLLRYYLVD